MPHSMGAQKDGNWRLHSKFLGEFAELRKATISCVMSVSLFASVRMEKLEPHSTDFHEIW